MFSLFSQNTSSRAPPKQSKKETESFDFDSFIHGVNNTSKNSQSANQSQKDIEKLLDVTSEVRRPQPVVSKGTQKLLQQINEHQGRVPKEIERASKRITHSLNELVSTQKYNKPKTITQKSVKDSSDNHKSAPKPRPDSERLKYLGSSYEDPGTRFLHSPNTKEDYPYKKGSMNSSPKASTNRRIPPKDSNERPRLMSRDKISEKKSDEDLNYNPLESSPFSLKEDPEWKMNIADSYEQYDPLDVSLKKKPAGEPARLAGKELVGLTAKRLGQGDMGNKYQADILKKVKMDDYGRKEATKAAFKDTKKLTPVSKPQQFRGGSNKGYRDEENSYEDEDIGDYDEEDDDEEDEDEAKAEFNKMMAAYRRKVVNRAEEVDSSDMEAGFEDIEREDRISRKIGELEDREELKLIQLEEMKERRGKTH